MCKAACHGNLIGEILLATFVVELIDSDSVCSSRPPVSFVATLQERRVIVRRSWISVIRVQQFVFYVL